MLTAHPPGPLEAAFWLDLVEPTPEEVELVEAATGLPVPSREALSEIETSSRLRCEGQVLFLSTPALTRGDTPEPDLMPLGFILTPRVLVTVRFASMKAFDGAMDAVGRLERPSAMAAFTAVVESVVDRAADLLEAAGAELDTLSRQIFRDPSQTTRRIAKTNARLRAVLTQVGRLGDRLGKIRGALLGLGRILPFVGEVGRDWIASDLQARMVAARADVVSLQDYETHLEGKNQFMLDAVLGFISTEQNDLFKILTIVSVVGVPPTLVASVYGMNFAIMPELHWRFGYPYALAMIVVSTVAPVVWFKWKGWW